MTSNLSAARRSSSRWVCALTGVVAIACAAPALAATIVYQNDFNAPAGWTDQSGNATGISFAQVNTLFGASFQQTFTVETIKIAGNASYADPSGTAGAYSLGMLSSAQNDLLSLTFNVGVLSFVNVAMDFAGIGPVACPLCGGPFASAGQVPVFDLRLFDTPTGAFNINSPGVALSSAAMTGDVIASTTTLGWNQGAASLSTAGNTNGLVTLLFDLRAGAGMAGYAAFDNIVIASSNVVGDIGGGVPAIPEPSTVALTALGIASLLGRSRLVRRR